MRKLTLLLLTLMAILCVASTVFADNLVFDLSPANGLGSVLLGMVSGNAFPLAPLRPSTTCSSF